MKPGDPWEKKKDLKACKYGKEASRWQLKYMRFQAKDGSFLITVCAIK